MNTTQPISSLKELALINFLKRTDQGFLQKPFTPAEEGALGNIIPNTKNEGVLLLNACSSNQNMRDVAVDALKGKLKEPDKFDPSAISLLISRTQAVSEPQDIPDNLQLLDKEKALGLNSNSLNFKRLDTIIKISDHHADTAIRLLDACSSPEVSNKLERDKTFHKFIDQILELASVETAFLDHAADLLTVLASNEVQEAFTTEHIQQIINTVRNFSETPQENNQRNINHASSNQNFLPYINTLVKTVAYYKTTPDTDVDRRQALQMKIDDIIQHAAGLKIDDKVALAAIDYTVTKAVSKTFPQDEYIVDFLLKEILHCVRLIPGERNYKKNISDYCTVLKYVLDQNPEAINYVRIDHDSPLGNILKESLKLSDKPYFLLPRNDYQVFRENCKAALLQSELEQLNANGEAKEQLNLNKIEADIEEALDYGVKNLIEDVCRVKMNYLPHALLFLDILHRVIEKTENVNPINAIGDTPLHSLLKSLSDLLSICDPALQENKDEKKSENDKYIDTAYQRVLDEVQFLIDKGADLTIKNYRIEDKGGIMSVFGAPDYNIEKDGITPLALAADSESTTVTRLLIDNGADTKSILTEIDLSQSEVIVKILLEAGADVMATDKMGNTPLHKAVKTVQNTINTHGNNEAENTKIVQLLLERGANPLVKNTRGETPLSIAESYDLEQRAKPADRWNSNNNFLEVNSTIMNLMKEKLGV